MIQSQMIKFEGKLNKIFYPKHSQMVNSGEFAIFNMNVDKYLDGTGINSKEIKLKGNVCELNYGTTYRVFCTLEDVHDLYGETYKVNFIDRCYNVSNKDKQKEFLKNILNENIVELLFSEFNNVIDILENNNVGELIKIKGIGKKNAHKIIEKYNKSKDNSMIYVELGRLGLTHNFIEKLVKFYKSPERVVEVIKNTPYDLVKVDGIGFKKADEIAIKLGIDKFDIVRIKNFIIYYLKEQGEIGKSYLNYQELMRALYDYLGYLPSEIINKVAKIMIDNKDVTIIDNGSKIALTMFYNLENKISDELIRLQNGKNDFSFVSDSIIIDNYIPKKFNIENWEMKINEIEKAQGFSFTEEQIKAIGTSINNNVMFLTGLAGAGKTSTANGICSLYKDCNILACALSGKASIRITETTGLAAVTIHKALGYTYGEFTYNKYNKLPVDIVIIDEATMINGTLFLNLLEAIPTGAKVIIMGDVQQLTPIGNCQVFADILDSNILPVAKLTKPHRQALKSGIIPTSIKIANQKQIFDNKYRGNQILGELEDMELDIINEDESKVDVILNHFKKEIDKFNNILEVQICVPMRLKGELSCYNLNNQIQNLYNPKCNNENEIEIVLEKTKNENKKYNIRAGDKVINTKNNYNCTTLNGKIMPVFNGNIGIVKKINSDKSCIIDFVGIGEVLFKKSSSKNLELAYACTCHKLQGSGFNSTIVGIDNSSYIMNNAELLYTAITRAKKYCVLVGSNNAIRKAIKTKEIKVKQTFLKDILIENKYKLNEDKL